jgi:hypothetical protein
MKQLPSIALSEPYPFLDPGVYVAVCTEATFAWARQWNKWIARLVLEPQNYQGRPYTGRLCKFLGLGKNKERPSFVRAVCVDALVRICAGLCLESS